MLFRFVSLAAILPAALLAQPASALPGSVSAPRASAAPALSAPAAAPGAAPPAASPSKPDSTEIKPDMTDPGVVRARQNLDRIQSLVRQGILPPINLAKAQDGLQDALDMSILRSAAYTTDLTPDQADQMVAIAERMLLRRQQRVIQSERLAASGAISRAEAEATGADVTSARLEYDLATERARLAQQIAESVRMQKALADAETDAESHPEMNGSLYTRYDGSGVFTRADFEKISAAFLAAFHHPIPVSADGQTAVHRAMGFDHTGRIDIALSPDQPEGAWLLRYLERNRIPYYAFRAAVAHKATGAHIHLGPGSTRLVATLR